MKILRFMHAAYQTIRLNSLIIKQKSVLKYSKKLTEFWPKKRQNLSKSLFLAILHFFDSFFAITPPVVKNFQKGFLLKYQ